MGYILIAGVVGMFIGFALGVLAMSLLAASQPDERLASPPDVHKSASAELGANESPSIMGSAERTHAPKGQTGRGSAGPKVPFVRLEPSTPGRSSERVDS